MLGGGALKCNLKLAVLQQGAHVKENLLLSVAGLTSMQQVTSTSTQKQAFTELYRTSHVRLATQQAASSSYSLSPGQGRPSLELGVTQQRVTEGDEAAMPKKKSHLASQEYRRKSALVSA